MSGFPQIDLGLYDTDKSTTYLEHYERELGHLASTPVRILELGIRRGGSLLLWRDLFPLSLVAGLDMLTIDVPDNTGRVLTYVGFQQDKAVLDHIANEVAPGGFDIIIDDASHVGQYTAASFQHLFLKHLKPGGIYVLEDWSCGYRPDWPDGHAFTGTDLLDSGSATLTSTSRSKWIEPLHRRVRMLAAAVSMHVGQFPALKERLRRVYVRAERATLQLQFPSHDFGMVGFVKQLIDSCAVDEMDPNSTRVPRRLIRSVHVAPSQVFVHKVMAGYVANA